MTFAVLDAAYEQSCASRFPRLRMRLAYPGRLGTMGKIAAVCLLATLMVAQYTTSAAADMEYRVKAAYLYNFLRFVDWPEQAFSSDDASYELCLLGHDPFGSSLTPVSSKRARKRSIHLRHLQPNADASGCHVLFISDSEAKRMPKILRRLRTAPVLTVSELPGFAKHGGMVGFVIDRGKVRLEVNLAAVRRSRLRMSSKLLEVASEVHR